MARLDPDPAPQQLSLFDAAPPVARQADLGDALRGPQGLASTALPAMPPADGPVPTAARASALPPYDTAAAGAIDRGAADRYQHPRGQRTVQLGEHRVRYEFRRARRRSIGFVVGTEGLSVSAPRWVGLAEVEQALRAKSGWILRKLHEQHERAQRLAAARVVWRDGAALPFLGETVIVVLDPRVTGAQLRSAADTLPGVPQLTLHVGLPQAAAENQVREAVQSWLQRQARRVFEERCALFAPRLGVTMRRLSLSSASTRWGSASADGSVRLNWRLVHFALPVIDYVVAHELAHLREMNHSAAFWDVVRSVVPDFEQRRGALRSELLPAFD